MPVPRLLPATVNRIASGETVRRPAGAVKKPVEKAWMDAEEALAEVVG